MKQRKQSRVRLVGTFLRGSTVFFVLSVVFASLKALFDLLLPQIIRFAVDNVLGGEALRLPSFVTDLLEKVGGTAVFREHLWMLALLTVSVGLSAVLCNFFDMLFCSMGAERLVKRMRDLLFSHILHLPFSFHMKNSTGDIIQRCTSDVETVKKFLSEQLTQLIRVILLLSMSLWFMFSMHAGLATVAVLLLPIVLLYSTYFGVRVRRTFAEADENEGILSQIAQENLAGVRVVRAFGREKHERERFRKQNEHYTGLWIKTIHNLSVFWAVGDLITGLQMLLIIVIGCTLCIGEGAELSAGEFIAFLSYNSMLVWPIRSLGRMISEMSKAGVSVDRIADIMHSEAERDAADCILLPRVEGDIVFEKVSFGYEGCPELLHDISFTVRKGETLGILGGTGAGKSTLVSLLCRLYPLEKGRITIGGTDIGKLPLKAVRESVGIVLQEPFLFSRTIEENIAITRESDRTEVEHAASVACLDEAIERFANGYATEVGERGVTLSGGQKQRLAIARLLHADTPIMVFDDSLSAVDTETDEKIRRALAAEMLDATVLLISHRISTLLDADKVLVLDGGRVAEYGTPEALLKQGGIFARIHAIQSGEEVADRA